MVYRIDALGTPNNHQVLHEPASIVVTDAHVNEENEEHRDDDGVKQWVLQAVSRQIVPEERHMVAKPKVVDHWTDVCQEGSPLVK